MRTILAGGLALALALLTLAACSDGPTGTDPPVGDPGVADTTRAPDPGLSYELGCLVEGEVTNCRGGSLPPDAIPSLVDPVFEDVDEIDFLRTDDRVLVLEAEGRVFGFPVRIMNYHEAATFDVLGPDGELRVRTTATWCPLTFSFVEWRNPWADPSAGRLSSFGVSGALLDNNLILYDRETRTQWSQILGAGILGDRLGECLVPGRNTADMPWSLFRVLYPDARVLSDTNGGRIGGPGIYLSNPYAAYWGGQVDPPEKITHEDGRLVAQRVVLAVRGPDGIAAVLLGNSTRAVVREVAGASLVFLHDPATGTAFAFENEFEGMRLFFTPLEPDEDGVPRFEDDETGSVWRIDGIAVEGPLAGKRLAQTPAFHVYWFALASLFPGVTLLNL